MKTAKAKMDNKALIMNDLLLKSDRFVVIDIEVTSLSPNKGGRIIEVAGVKIEGGRITETFSQLVNPEQKIYQKTIQLTGITNEMLEGKPVYGQVLPQFYRFIGDAVVVSHNAMFDWDRFLIYFFKKVGIIARNPVIDTMVLSKLYYPYRKKFGLAEMCAETGIQMDRHHRALDDAMSAAMLLLYFKENLAPQFAQAEETIPEQLELFAVETPSPTSVSIPKVLKIKRVSYWEKQITKKKKMERIYVTTSIGTVYFDVPTRTWYNKDVNDAIDFDALQQAVLTYLKLDSIEELCQFRNTK